MIRFFRFIVGVVLFIAAFLLLLGVLWFQNSLTVFQGAPLIAVAVGLIGLARSLIRPWWRTRKWYRDLYDFTQEMVPYSPLEVEILDNARNENYQPLVEAYRVKMEIIPDEVNRTFRGRPPETPVSESFVECLCNEGYSLRDRLRGSDQDTTVSYVEVKQSVMVIDAASLVIRHQIEEEVWMFRPRKADKLPDKDTGISPKDHARDIYDYYSEEGDSEGVRSTLQEAYYETNSKPWYPE